MGLKNLYNYLRGDVRAEIDGMEPERVLTKLSRRGTEMWQIEYTEKGAIRVSMPASEYRSMRPVMRKSGCRVRLISRKGLLYTARRARRRYVVIAGLILLSVMAFYMNSVILTIEVTGCETLKPSEIIAAMERQGVKRFTRTKTVDASDLRNYILSDMPKLIWFTVNFSGSRAMVDVRERDDPPEIADNTNTADIFSDCDGVITKMQVYRGTAEVKEHQVIHKGDMLVSGTVQLHTYNEPMDMHASADIWARVWTTETAATPLTVAGKLPTGRTNIRLSLIFGYNRVNFYRNSGKVFDNCDKITKRYMLGESMGLSLPIGVEVQCSYEYETVEKHLDETETGRELTAAVRREILKNENTEILSKRTWTENGWLMTKVNAETERKIGVTVIR